MNGKEKNSRRAECKTVFKPEGEGGKSWMLSEVRVPPFKEGVTLGP